MYMNITNTTEFEHRYTKEAILNSEKLYGTGYQSPCKFNLVDDIITKYPFNYTPYNILEIGCGLGGNCNELQTKFNSKVVGIDICKPMIDICLKRNTNTNIDYHITDYKNYTHNTNFDLILCRDVFMYIDVDNKVDYLKKCRSDLNKGGMFILIDYCIGKYKNIDFENYCEKRNWNCISILDYETRLIDSGFTIVDSVNISKKYIDAAKDIKNTNKHIDAPALDNLNNKIRFLENEWFEWHYFILN